ncbi:MAG TPA: hypothetical protein PKD54_04900 [Pirellulaceae bacterium]|nr:hypothetical protein [Pirellulaceae bacterium]
MARSARRPPAPNPGEHNAPSTSVPILTSLLRKLEQTEFVQEERWSTLQHILSGMAHRIDAINRKVDALIEWQLMYHPSGSGDQLVLESSLDDQGAELPILSTRSETEELLRQLEYQALADEAQSPEATDESFDNFLEQEAVDFEEEDEEGYVEQAPSNTNALDWNQQREKLLRSYESGPAERSEGARRRSAARGRSTESNVDEQPADRKSKSPSRGSHRRDEPAPSALPDVVLDIDSSLDTLSEPSDLDSSLVLSLSDDSDLVATSAAAQPEDNLTMADQLGVVQQNKSEPLNDVESLREQLLQAIRQSELELSIMRAQMSQERARLEQMEAEIKQREKNLQRNSESGKDRQASRLKSFIRPSDGG